MLFLSTFVETLRRPAKEKSIMKLSVVVINQQVDYQTFYLPHALNINVFFLSSLTCLQLARHRQNEEERRNKDI